MTMLSPLGRVPRQRPPVRRRTRRAGPALVLLLALSMLAILVWWRVLHRGPVGSAASACPASSAAAVLSLDPRRVEVRVYNASGRAGLARSVAVQLHQRGFSISATSNDPLADIRPVTGVGEVRYGTQGATQAELVSWHFPGVRKAEDPRTGAVVDVAIGPGFHRLATAAQIAEEKQAAAKAAPSSGC